MKKEVKRIVDDSQVDGEDVAISSISIPAVIYMYVYFLKVTGQNWRGEVQCIYLFFFFLSKSLFIYLFILKLSSGMQTAYAKYYNSVTNFPENTEGVSLGKKIDKIVQAKPIPAASRTLPVYSMQDSESIHLIQNWSLQTKTEIDIKIQES